MTIWFIVWLVRTFNFENWIWFWIAYSNSNTFHVESFSKIKHLNPFKIQTFKFKQFKIWKSAGTLKSSKRDLKIWSLVPGQGNARDQWGFTHQRGKPQHLMRVGPGPCCRPGTMTQRSRAVALPGTDDPSPYKRLRFPFSPHRARRTQTTTPPGCRRRALALVQIGRASCRERVCLYV